MTGSIVPGAFRKLTAPLETFTEVNSMVIKG